MLPLLIETFLQTLENCFVSVYYMVSAISEGGEEI